MSVRFCLKGCPKIGRQKIPNTLSELCSTCVRKVRKSPVGQHRTSCRSYAQTLSDFASKGVRKSADRKFRTHCRTYAQHVSEKSENRQSDSIGHRVGVMLKHCPILPQRVSENWPTENSEHVVGVMLNMCPKSPKIASRTRCRSYAQQVSDSPSRGVRKSIEESVKASVLFGPARNAAGAQFIHQSFAPCQYLLGGSAQTIVAPRSSGGRAQDNIAVFI